MRVKVTLKEQYAQNWRNWKSFPRPIKKTYKDNKLLARIKIAKSLIENGHIQVKFKTLTNPGLKVEPNAWTRRTNIHMTYDYSSLNAYLFHFPTWRRPLNFVKKENSKVYPKGTDEWLFDFIQYMPARRTKHYKHKKFINKTHNDDLKSLDHIIFKAGWANSIKHARHLIRQAQISVDGVKVYNFKFIPNKGSLITNLTPDSIFNYYRQRYHANFRTKRSIPVIPKRKKRGWKKKLLRLTKKNNSIMQYLSDPSSNKFSLFLPEKTKTNTCRPFIIKNIWLRYTDVVILENIKRYSYITYPFAIQPQYITKTNFNQVLYL